MDGTVERLQTVTARIEAAEKAAGRPPASVTLSAVPKAFEESASRPVLEAGAAGESGKRKQTPLGFGEANTGGGARKAGVTPLETDAFVGRCRDVHGLRIAGLMCIPPVNDVPAPHFALLAKIAKRLQLSF